MISPQGKETHNFWKVNRILQWTTMVAGKNAQSCTKRTGVDLFSIFEGVYKCPNLCRVRLCGVTLPPVWALRKCSLSRCKHSQKFKQMGHKPCSNWSRQWIRKANKPQGNLFLVIYGCFSCTPNSLLAWTLWHADHSFVVTPAQWHPCVCRFTDHKLFWEGRPEVPALLHRVNLNVFELPWHLSRRM